MRDQRKEDKSLRTVPSGYEEGFLGMEGRGLYAGATVAGLHAEVSERDGDSWGFRGSVYYGSTDEGNDLGADGHRKVSRLLWFPELGALGHFKLGASVDETKKGLGITQMEKTLEMVGKIDKSYAEELREAYKKSETGYSLTEMQYEKLSEFLVTKGGLKRVWRPSLPWDSYHKDTYAKGGLDYGNIEFKYWPGCDNVFSSYNYGNNVIDHFFLDVIGYLMSN